MTTNNTMSPIMEPDFFKIAFTSIIFIALPLQVS